MGLTVFYWPFSDRHDWSTLSVDGLAKRNEVSPILGERVRGGDPLPSHLQGAIVALGNFDGFHLGHQAVARRARAMADERGVAAIIATFDPHPVRHFRSEMAPFRLMSLDQRQRAACGAGIDAMMVFDFNERLANASPEEFVVDWLRGAGGIVTGSTFAFGKDRAGDVSTLQMLARQSGLVYSEVGPVTLGGEVVSSTRIRKALACGDCATATKLMARPFTLAGKLTESQIPEVGSLSGAQLSLADYQDIGSGDYSVLIRCLGRPSMNALASITNAQVDPVRTIQLFAHDLTSRDLGDPIEVEFLARHGAAEHHGG